MERGGSDPRAGSRGLVDDPRLLLTFLAIVDAGTVSAAADDLAVTPSAVSQHLGRLERSVGVALFERRGRRLQLTAAGEDLAVVARRVASAMADADAAMADHRGLRTGRVRLGTFPTAGATIVPSALRQLVGSHPAAAVSLVVGEPFEVEPGVESGETDIAVVYRYAGIPRPFSERLWSRQLFADPLRVLVPAGGPHAGRRSVALADLSDEWWIAPGPETDGESWLFRNAALSGFTPRIRCRSREYEMSQAMVAQGLGVAVIPALALYRQVSGVDVLWLDAPAAHRVLSIVGRHGATNPLAAVAADLLVSAAA